MNFGQKMTNSAGGIQYDPTGPYTPHTTKLSDRHIRALPTIVASRYPRLTPYHIGLGAYRDSIGTRKRTRTEAGLVGYLEEVQDP